MYEAEVAVKSFLDVENSFYEATHSTKTRKKNVSQLLESICNGSF